MFDGYGTTESTIWKHNHQVRAQWETNNDITDFTNLVCIKHPKYDGITYPETTCHVCRRRYINNIINKESAIFGKVSDA